MLWSLWLRARLMRIILTQSSRHTYLLNDSTWNNWFTLQSPRSTKLKLTFLKIIACTFVMFCSRFLIFIFFPSKNTSDHTKLIISLNSTWSAMLEHFVSKIIVFYIEEPFKKKIIFWTPLSKQIWEKWSTKWGNIYIFWIFRNLP